MSTSSALLRLQKHSAYGEEQLWKVCDRLADKQGFRHNVYWVTGEQYRGCWIHNKKDGIGIFMYRDGNRYEGQWKNGKREGQGTYWVVDGGKYKALYRGLWREDQWHGKGMLYGDDEIYEGDFDNGRRSGLGKQTCCCNYSDGYEVYVGNWSNNKREGMGTLHKANGDRYEGSFVNGLQDGRGVLYFSDKCSKYEGLWHADVPICGTYTKMEEGHAPVLPFLEVEGSDTLAEKFIQVQDKPSTSCAS